MDEEIETKLSFIKDELINLMLSKPALIGKSIVKCSVELKSHLDGFMSSIFTVQLLVEDRIGRLIINIGMNFIITFKRKSLQAKHSQFNR